MKYFIMMPGDTDESVLYESNELGEETGFGTFWAGRGLFALMQMVDSKQEMLTQVKILDDKKYEYTITEFLDKIKSLKVKLQ
jgi:hypothetical protein